MSIRLAVLTVSDRSARGERVDASGPALAEKIREVLTEQKLNDLMSSWLQTLRAEGEVRYRPR